MGNSCKKEENVKEDLKDGIEAVKSRNEVVNE